MDIQFDITAGFDADLVKFSASDRKLIAAKLNQYCAISDESGSVPSSRFFDGILSCCLGRWSRVFTPCESTSVSMLY
ncbi:MAG: hypothetical protein V4476_08125 [Pseudomonadota bacterium]